MQKYWDQRLRGKILIREEQEKYFEKLTHRKVTLFTVGEIPLFSCFAKRFCRKCDGTIPLVKKNHVGF